LGSDGGTGFGFLQSDGDGQHSPKGVILGMH
jgi:hypothetical protein